MHLPRPVLIILLSLGSFIPVRSQKIVSNDTSGVAGYSIRYPYPSKAVKTESSIGISMVRPPKDLLETAVQFPLLNFHVRYNFPFHLSLEGDFTTIIVSNQLSIGPGLNFSTGSFGFKAGYDIAYTAGFLRQLGFDNSTRAWLHYPNISIGYKMNQLVMTLEIEAIVIQSIKTESGKNELTHSKNMFNGYTGAVYIEQRLHRNRIFIIGFKNNYVKYYWPAWMAFSTFNRFYNIPELYFSWII